jgi:hypothetical protein
VWRYMGPFKRWVPVIERVSDEDGFTSLRNTQWPQHSLYAATVHCGANHPATSYNSALAYELISQFRLISSNCGTAASAGVVREKLPWLVSWVPVAIRPIILNRPHDATT